MKVSSVTVRDSTLSLEQISLDFVFVSFISQKEKRKEGKEGGGRRKDSIETGRGVQTARSAQA